MIALVVTNFYAVGEVAGTGCEGDAACQAGAVIGGGMFAAVGWFAWILGTVVLGILMLSTRGKLVTTEV